MAHHMTKVSNVGHPITGVSVSLQRRFVVLDVPFLLSPVATKSLVQCYSHYPLQLSYTMSKNKKNPEVMNNCALRA